MTQRRAQILAAAGLSLLFLFIYGGAAQITRLRLDVGTLYFEWERFIPFVPIFVIPYMSIDLFFVAAPFLCTDKRELRLLCLRIAAGILIAGAFFLLMPLKLAITRPTVDGPLGMIFRSLHAFDMPYNLLPSLHIILRTILAHLYVRKTQGWLRAAVRVWFVLIGLSTLLVYQHHVADVVAGFIVALLIFYFIADSRQWSAALPNPKIGRYYLAGSLLCAAGAIALLPWGLILLWPALACAMVTIGYFRFGSAITAKSAGRLPFTTRLVLLPWLMGQWLSLRHYSRRCRAWDEVSPRVWIGRVLTDREAADAVVRGVRAVVDLTCEFDEARPLVRERYVNLPVLDLTAPSPALMGEAARFIDAESKHGVVYVHCKIGYSRSVAVVGAWLLMTGQAKTVDEAVEIIRAARPTIVVRREVRDALEAFAVSLNS